MKLTELLPAELDREVERAWWRSCTVEVHP